MHAEKLRFIWLNTLSFSTYNPIQMLNKYYLQKKFNKDMYIYSEVA